MKFTQNFTEDFTMNKFSCSHIQLLFPFQSPTVVQTSHQIMDWGVDWILIAITDDL